MNNFMPDIPRFYTAFAEWLTCMIFILPLKKRTGKIQTAFIMTGALLIQGVFLVLTGSLPLCLWIPCMILAVLLMVGFIFACCDVNRMDAVYFGMIAFVMAEFLASIEWQVVCFFCTNGIAAIWIRILLLLGIYGVLSLILLKILHAHLPKDGKMNISPKELFSALVIVIAVFAVSNLSFLTINTPFSGTYSFEIGNIRTLVDLGGIAILYAHLIQCSELRVRKELEAVQSVLQNQYVQYKQSRESIELINYKYHDLKHQIAVLRSEEDPKKREEFLNRMENEIKQYEAQNKTGNKVLDTVLTTKSLYCTKHGITFTCVADGTLLDFMDVMDISNLFGNALDNAIESCAAEPDPEKRLIRTAVYVQNGFVMFRFENYCAQPVELGADGLPAQSAHGGYDLKSLRSVAQQHGGSMTVHWENRWFTVRLLMPLPKEK